MINPLRLAQIAEASVTTERATGCPAELLVAQCGLESSWLADAPEYNCFGIKAYGGCYCKQLLRTKEWFSDKDRSVFLNGDESRTADLVMPVQQDKVGRKLYAVRDWFAGFQSLSDCFSIRARMFSAGRYAPASVQYAKDRDLAKYIRTIGPIYASAPSYAATVLSIINQADVKQAISTARAELKS